MGRDTEISRMLMPHGRPTYILHMLLHRQHRDANPVELFLLVVDENSPKSGPSNIKVPLAEHPIAVLFCHIEMQPEISTKPHSHASRLHQFLTASVRDVTNLPLYSQPRASRVKAASVALIITSACTVATLGLSISISSRAFARDEKNSGFGKRPLSILLLARLAPIAQLDVSE